MKLFGRASASSSDADLLKAEKELAGLNKELAWELSKAAVDVVGLVDPTPIADAVSMGMSLADGDLIGAGLSLVSMVPYAGDALAKTTKGARAAKKILKLQKKIAALSAKVRALKGAKAAKGTQTATKTIRKAKAAPSQKPEVCVECAKRAAKKKQASIGRDYGKKKIKSNRGPNPYGRHGKPPHRNKVKERALELQRQGHKILAGGGKRPERAVITPDGKKRYPDIISRGPDGKIHYENVGRINKSGQPVVRERRALDSIEAATGKRPRFTPYHPKKK